MNDIIPTLFRIINFGIIVGFVIYLYRRFGKDILVVMFEDHEKAKVKLREDAESLQKRAQELESAFLKQRILAERLTHNVELWHFTVSQAIAHRQEEKAALTTLLQKKSERVARSVAWLSIQRACLANAIAEATASLTVYYQRDDHARAYLAQAFKQLKGQS